MGAKEAVEFLIEDHGDVNPPKGFRKDFAEDLPIKSLLQRGDKTLDELLDIFSWKEEDGLWREEYNKPADSQDEMKMIRYRRRIAFCVGGWRELNEDFGRGDVSCLREIRTPLVTSRSPLMASKDEFDDGNGGG